MKTQFKILFPLIALMFIVSSCEESQKSKIIRLVKEWEGKTILFPDHPVFSVMAQDTVDFRIPESGYKVITYVDSIGCLSCKLQLNKWKIFIRETDSLTNSSVPVLFFFGMNNLKEMRYILRRERFDYPVCIDAGNEIDRLNRFPAEMDFQTFLLDGANKVVAMGNPVLNPNIKKLYFNILTGQKDTSGSQRISTGIKADKDVVNLGKFSWKEEQQISFTLHNTGSNLLVIDDIVTSCGCIEVKYSNKPVQPGRSVEVLVTYKADQPEYFEKTLTVYCNSENSPLVLKISGDAQND